MRMLKTFREIKVGDRVWNSGYYARDKFQKVTGIQVGGSYISLYLETSTHPTIDTRTCLVGYPEQAIMTQLE